MYDLCYYLMFNKCFNTYLFNYLHGYIIVCNFLKKSVKTQPVLKQPSNVKQLIPKNIKNVNSKHPESCNKCKQEENDRLI